MTALSAAIVLDDGLPKGPPIVLEGQVVDDDEEEDRPKDAPMPGVDDEDRLPRLVREAQDDGRL